MTVQSMIDLGVPLFPAFVAGEKKQMVKVEGFQFKIVRETIFTQ